MVAPRVLDEGIDVPDADLGIVVNASRTRRQMIQRMGRILRRKRPGVGARFVILYATDTIEDPSMRFERDGFLDEIERISGCRAQVVCSTAKDIKATLQSYLPAANVFVIDDIIEDNAQAEVTLIETAIDDIGDMAEFAGKFEAYQKRARDQRNADLRDMVAENMSSVSDREELDELERMESEFTSERETSDIIQELPLGITLSGEWMPGETFAV